MRSLSFTLCFSMIFVSAAASAAAQVSSETFISTRTWHVSAGTAESEKLVRFLEATKPEGLRGTDQHFEGSDLTIKYVHSGQTANDFTPGGGQLPTTGHQGDTYSVTSCNLHAKTVTTVEYEWDDSANDGAGGWVVKSSSTVFQAGMTSCPGK